MKFQPNISPKDVIKREHLEEHILEIFILVSIINFKKIAGKNLKN